MSSSLSNLLFQEESSLIICTDSWDGGVVILADLRDLGVSKVAANLRAFCTVFEKVSPNARNLRYCYISEFHEPSSNLVLSDTSRCSDVAFGHATLYSDVNACSNSTTDCLRCSNFHKASLASSTSSKRRDKASQISCTTVGLESEISFRTSAAFPSP